MPDLTIETQRTCATNLRWQRQYPSNSRPGVMHTVSFGPTARGAQFAYDYVCDCEAGRRGLTCYHIKQAMKDRCGWGVEAFCGDDPQPNTDKTCPKCGGPTEVARIGV